VYPRDVLNINPCVPAGAVSRDAGDLPEVLQSAEGDGAGECTRPAATV